MNDVLSVASADLAAAVDTRLKQWRACRFAERLWSADASLWTTQAAVRERIDHRLGWLTAPQQMRARIGELAEFAQGICESGITDVVLLGMGGSSLAAEVLAASFGPRAGYPQLAVLDNTAPDAVRAVEQARALDQTLFIVASKSGATTETAAFADYFHARYPPAEAGRHFIAITDPGSTLADAAQARGYRKRFLNAPDIGGRFSALSYFGLVPAALLGIDLETLLDRAADFATRSRAEPPDNAALQLGALMGEAALAGRDKLILDFDPALRPLVPWIEQLVAECSGKQGRGIVPIPACGEIGDDALVIQVNQTEIVPVGTPSARWRVGSPLDLGAEFLRWEIATAAACAILGVNPYDEPDVASSKRRTAELLDAGGPDEDAPLTNAHGLTLYGDGPAAADVAQGIDAFLATLRPGDYLAVLAYLPDSPRTTAQLEQLCRTLRQRVPCVVSTAYGPRYLHSTGQLHKGGANIGAFLQITAQPSRPLPIPGRSFSFAQLQQAQALGDYQALRQRGRRIIRVHCQAVAEGLATLNNLL